MTSADGRGRNLFEIITGRNKRDMRPLELQYHNPLEAKVGSTVSFSHEPSISGINFVIEAISVYKTKIRSKSFFHTDYHLKGVSLDHDAPVRLRLRLIPDENVENELGHRVQLLYLYQEMGYDKSLHTEVLADPSGELQVNHDDDGKELEVARKYWRVEDVIDPYRANVTLLKDADGDGTIEDEELERRKVTYWDFHRDTTNPDNGIEFREFLTVEMDGNVDEKSGKMEGSGYFRFLRGSEIHTSEVTVY